MHRDVREAFKGLSSTDSVRVPVTRHALVRLKEHKVKDYWKFDSVVIENIIINTIRDGGWWFTKNGDIKIATKKYTLVCTQFKTIR